MPPTQFSFMGSKFLRVIEDSIKLSNDINFNSFHVLRNFYEYVLSLRYRPHINNLFSDRLKLKNQGSFLENDFEIIFFGAAVQI